MHNRPPVPDHRGMRRRPQRSGWTPPPASIRRVPHYRRLGIDWSRVRHRLGREPDARLADEIGCSATAVYKKRGELGIPPYTPPTVELAVVVRRFGRLLSSAGLVGLFESRRIARRWLAGQAEGDTRLLPLGATRNRRWMVVPEGIDAEAVARLDPSVLGLLEGALEASHDRDVLAAGLTALGHDPDAIRAAGAAALAE